MLNISFVWEINVAVVIVVVVVVVVVVIIIIIIIIIIQLLTASCWYLSQETVYNPSTSDV
jgi:hypothetical protein